MNEFYDELADLNEELELNDEELKILEEVSDVGAQTWFNIAAWSKETNRLLPWQRSLAFSLGRIANQGKSPTTKQALQGYRILNEVTSLGFFQNSEKFSS